MDFLSDIEIAQRNEKWNIREIAVGGQTAGQTA